MRIFVAGATGVVGQRAVRALVAAGQRPHPGPVKLVQTALEPQRQFVT